MTDMTCDLLVVGAGPAGLYAAYYAGFRGLSVAIVDTLPEPGGQVTAMYPEKAIFDVGGFAAIKGRDLVEGLVEQAGQYKPTYLLGRQAVELAESDEGFTVSLADGGAVRTSSVLITGGLGTFTARPLPAPSAASRGRLQPQICRPHTLVATYCLRSAIGNQGPVIEHDHPIGKRIDKLHVVLHEHLRQTIAAEPEEDLDQRLFLAGPKPRGRLIEQERARSLSQCPGHREQAQLTERQPLG